MKHLIHNKIVNIPVSGKNHSKEYLIGHRDARHMSAEIGAEADERIMQLNKKLYKVNKLIEMILKGEVDTDTAAVVWERLKGGEMINSTE